MSLPVFHVIGTSLNARRALGDAEGRSASLTNVTNAAVIADASAIGGSSIDFGSGETHRCLFYKGFENLVTTQGVTMVLRFKTANVNHGLFSWGGKNFGFANYNGLAVFHQGGTGNIQIFMIDGSGFAGLANAVVATAVPVDTWLDMVLTFTGDTTTNGFKCYIDGVLTGEATCTRSFDNPQDVTRMPHLYLGRGIGNTAQGQISEFALYEGVKAVNDFQLTDLSTGTLDGASRTLFLNSVAFDGGLNTHPDPSDVVDSAPAWKEAGVDVSPTRDEPAVTDVLSGVQWANTTKTGTRDEPLENQVQLGVSWANATKTGTLDVNTIITNEQVLELGNRSLTLEG